MIVKLVQGTLLMLLLGPFYFQSIQTFSEDSAREIDPFDKNKLIPRKAATFGHFKPFLIKRAHWKINFIHFTEKFKTQSKLQ